MKEHGIRLNGVKKKYATNLLGLLGSDEKTKPAYLNHTGAILTPREVEVLHLLPGMPRGKC